MIDIRVAESAGFCPGVNAAIEKVIELASNGNKRIYTLGQLIHNNDIIKELEKRGIKAIDDPLQITDPQNSILVIRAHGIPPEVEEEIRSKNIEIVDATCPLVKKVHKIITEYRKKGYRTVIFGDHKHAEVIGLKGYAGDDGIVVSSIEEVEKLPFMEKVNFVSQTTQQEEIFIEAAKILQKKTKDLVISDTICQPTKKRQKETIALAKESDLTIVVGGKHSANTKRLFDICSRLSKKVILVEDELEISSDILDGVKTVFITAGASTPRWIVEKVIDKIKSLALKKNFFYEFINFFTSAGLFGLFSFSGIMILSLKILKADLKTNHIISSVFALIFAHLINRISYTREEDLKKMIILKHLKTAKLLMYLLPAISLILSLPNLKFFLAIFLFIILSIIYKKKYPKTTISKKLILPIGWIYIYSAVPMIYSKHYDFLLIAFNIAFILSLAIIRTEIFETLYLHSDLISKEKKSRKFYSSLPLKFIVLCLISMLILLTPTINIERELKIYWLFAFMYLILMFRYIISKKLPYTTYMEVAVDIPFAGLLVYFIMF